MAMRFAFQDKKELTVAMKYMPGGDLRFYLLSNGAMKSDAARFFTAQTVLGMEELHKNDFVYRDLKPENLLLDEVGNISISDFGLAYHMKDGETKCDLEAGTSGYMAPEMLMKKGYDYKADYFSFGVTLCEFLTNKQPFRDDKEICSSAPVSLPFDGPGAEICRGCLAKSPEDRMFPWADIKKHEFFKDFDWDKCEKRELTPPFKPKTDQVNCTKDAELNDMFFAEESTPKITPEQQKQFEGFEFNADAPEAPPA